MKMTIRQMQTIDKYVGALICDLLSLLNRVRRLFPVGDKAARPVKKVALLKFWGMGTIIVAAPSLRSLRKKYPGAEIVFVTFRNNTDIVSMLSIADRTIGIRIKNGPAAFLKDTLAALLALRRESVDVLYDLEFFTRFSAIVSFLSGAPERIGFYSWDIRRGDLHTNNVSFNRYWHMSENFRNLLGVEPPSPGFRLPVNIPADAGEFVHHQMDEQKIPRDNFICVNVNAAVAFGWERRWEGKRFAELTDRLIEEYGVNAIFIGDRSEREYVAGVIAAGKKQGYLHNWSGSTNAAQLAALFGESRMLVSNDTGPLHLAAALGVPTVSFFGSDTPVLYGPQGGQHLIFYRNIDCSPCVSVMVSKEIQCHKGYPQCLYEITVDDVFQAIKAKGILHK